MPTVQSINEAILAGRQAYASGIPLHACTLHHLSSHYVAWVQGWCMAQKGV